MSQGNKSELAVWHDLVRRVTYHIPAVTKFHEYKLLPSYNVLISHCKRANHVMKLALSAPLSTSPFLTCFTQFGWHVDSSGNVCITWEAEGEDSDSDEADLDDSDQDEEDTNLFEDEAHCLDYQTVTSEAAQQQSSAIQQYALGMRKLSTLKEEKIKLEEQAGIVEQVNFITTPQLVEAMLNEATKLRRGGG